MNTRMRRLLGLLLAFAMVLSLGMPAVAEDLSQEEAESDQIVAVQSQAEQELSQTEEEEPEDSGEESEDTKPEKSEAKQEESVEAQEEQEEEAPVLNYSVLTLTIGKSEQLMLAGGEIASVTSSDECVSAEQDGKLTGQKVGSAFVTVTDVQGTEYECQVTVEPTTTTSKVKLTVAGEKTLKLEGRTIAEAKSSSKKLATVDAKGKVKALKSGRVTITLTDTLGDVHKYELTIASKLNTTKAELSETKTLQLKLAGSAVKKAKSSNEKVAIVSETGKVTALMEGTAKITLTDNAGQKHTAKVTVKPNYLNRTAVSAKKVYGKIVSLHCHHSGGTRSYSQLLKRKKITCGTGVSVALQEAGLLKSGDVITHTQGGSGNGRHKLKSVSKALKNQGRLKKGTYTIYKAGCKYSKLPEKYKAAGMVYVQDSNICISAGDGYIYTTNESSRQYRHGQYFKTRMNAGYTHSHDILFVIAPNS